jgi:phospholipid/cholesterol/gamma-HCH transport system substrate-binding protein
LAARLVDAQSGLKNRDAVYRRAVHGEVARGEGFGKTLMARLAAIGSVVIAAALCALIVFGWGQDYRVRAHFQTASTLVEGNIVQTSGRTVGIVERIRLAPNGLAEVEMKLDGDIAPLRVGTKANVRARSLSGSASRFVDLDMAPGTVRETIPDGGLIPSADTTVQVEIDHFFNLFDEQARRGIRNVVRGFGTAYDGREAEVREAFEYFNPSLVQARRLFAELAHDRAALRSFLASTSDLWTELAARRGDLVVLVDRLAVMLDAIAQERRSLAEAINRLPVFMRRANSTFVNLRATLDDATPLVLEARPVAPKLRAVLAELRPFARDAAPTFRNLAALVRSPGRLNDLIDLGRAVIAFRDVALRAQEYNGKRREGSFPAAVRSLRSQTPQFAFQRPYAVDLAGWFDDFSHSGLYDANGSASRIATSVNAFALVNGVLTPVPEELRGEVLNRVATLRQNNRCPGSTERPAEDGGNPFKPHPEFNCDETQVPPGR